MALSGVAISANAALLEEVIVTAQKREQSQQDVGIAITAFTGDQMKALGVTNTVEITEQVPALQMTSFSPNLVAFNIRGVSQNNFTDNNEAPVAVYIDDGYVASVNALGGQLFDVERVEVLRGPQGTLFGRNATGGVIHYITRGADDVDTNGYVESTVAEFGKFTIEGAIGGSFSDTARYRFAARSEESDGYIESTDFPEGNPLPASGQDLGGADGIAIRGAFQFDLSPTAQLELLYKYSRDDDVPTGGYNFLPYADASEAFIPPEFQDFVTNVIGAPAEATADIFFCPSQLDCFAPVDTAGRTIFDGDHPTPFQNFSDFAGSLNRETNNITARFDVKLPNGMDFVSITNYSNTDKVYSEDGDGIPVPIIEFTTIADFTQASQEFRISAESEQLRWQAGVYFLDIEIDAEVITQGAPVAGEAAGLGFIDANGDGLAVNARVAQDYVLDSRNWSIFGQLEYDVNDRNTVIAGYRYSQDDKELDFLRTFEADGLIDPATGVSNNTPVSILGLDLQTAVAAIGGDQDEVDFGDSAIRLQWDHRPNDNTLWFASYNRGIKGGNFAPSANVTLDRVRHDAETLDAFEIGVKSELADGRVRLNATAFYYDYSDYQAFTFAEGTPSVSNADAENQGLEIEAVLIPNDHWDIILGASLQDSSVDNVETPQAQVTPVGFLVDFPVDFLNDVELPNAPSFSANYLFRYNLDALGGNLAFQLDGAFYGDQFLEVTNGGAAFQSSYNISNASVTWANETWSVKAWVKNLGDQEFKQYALDLGILGGTAVYAPPRWAGVTVGYNF